MARVAVAMGTDALRLALEIVGRCGGSAGQWGGDRLLLSVDVSGVRCVIGSVLYQQDLESFRMEQPGARTALPPAWMRGLSPQEAPFCMGLAGGLIPAWGDSSACAFLERFGSFYTANRPRLDLAARDMRYIAEALLAMQHWPALFGAVVEFVGEPAQAALAKSGSPGGLGGFLGAVLIGSAGGGVPLYGLPGALRGMRDPVTPEVEACLRVPHYARMLDSLERAADRAAPIVEQLLAALGLTRNFGE